MFKVLPRGGEIDLLTVILIERIDWTLTIVIYSLPQDPARLYRWATWWARGRKALSRLALN